MRRDVLGAEHVDRSLEQASAFARPMQELVTEYCWGAVWSRPGLDRKTRSLLNLAMLTALDRPHELQLHLRGALNNGVTARGDPGGAAAGGDLLRRARGDGRLPHRRGAARGATASTWRRPRRERHDRLRRARRDGRAHGRAPARRRARRSPSTTPAPRRATRSPRSGRGRRGVAARGRGRGGDRARQPAGAGRRPQRAPNGLLGGAAMRRYVDLSTTGAPVAEEVAAPLGGGGRRRTSTRP